MKALSTNYLPVFIELKISFNFLDVVIFVKCFRYKRIDRKFLGVNCLGNLKDHQKSTFFIFWARDLKLSGNASFYSLKDLECCVLKIVLKKFFDKITKK